MYEHQMKVDLGEEMYNTCDAGSLSAILAYLSNHKLQNPSSDPPLSTIMYVAAGKDHSLIDQHCLASGGKVTSQVMDHIRNNRSIKTYDAILAAEAVDVNDVMGYMGDMLTWFATDTALAMVAEEASVAMAVRYLTTKLENNTVDITPHAAIPGNLLPPRDASPCPLDEDCGPIVVGPTPTTTSSISVPSATTCTVHHGPVPIGTECFESGPHAGQCITFECLELPNACGCPNASPPAASKEKRNEAASSDCDNFIGEPTPVCTDEDPRRGQCSQTTPRRTVLPTLVKTSCELDGSGCVCLDCEEEKHNESEDIGEVCFVNGTCAPTIECLEFPDSSTCLTPKEKRSEALPIGFICFENGTCTTFECLDHPDSPGCATEKEKRSEDAQVKRDDSAWPMRGGYGPVCVEPVCESCPDLPECAGVLKRSPQETCHQCGPS
ncbi:hypothetical protein HO133_003564 [Letharia lupina]|uniref:Uncharacterized protein n=1 Tax=Letharia lupina TaxID=560253 RepID=A0A8H6F9M1_9LECA|nr:uncharacterized protein HO133_003564 [Letharia lupina]KAF6219739.1 hypothetical protein HO133_003564 [Letharia lupina]